ncbi:hypothetical protein DL897_10910 [Thermoflavimicrobium daqui]|uniref:Uncharacterized protein n=1 Tax=Thermoflavimicrobium daqui TaxID=2137476 RepID=A0A364K4I3_9BACL|nr:hypothetical protein [Paenibacillus sp. MSJ-34]RAL24298.1 hypothetical protein DL897_10910 [Thermoflavimicrobium daqui]
MRLRFPTLNR